jgi:hypothetical protein
VQLKYWAPSEAFPFLAKRILEKLRKMNFIRFVEAQYVDRNKLRMFLTNKFSNNFEMKVGLPPPCLYAEIKPD